MDIQKTCAKPCAVVLPRLFDVKLTFYLLYVSIGTAALLRSDFFGI